MHEFPVVKIGALRDVTPEEPVVVELTRDLNGIRQAVVSIERDADWRVLPVERDDGVQGRTEKLWRLEAQIGRTRGREENPERT